MIATRLIVNALAVARNTKIAPSSHFTGRLVPLIGGGRPIRLMKSTSDRSIPPHSTHLEWTIASNGARVVVPHLKILLHPTYASDGGQRLRLQRRILDGDDAHNGARWQYLRQAQARIWPR